MPKNHQFQGAKSVRIHKVSGLYSVQIQENTDQKKSEYGKFQAVMIMYEFLSRNQFAAYSDNTGDTNICNESLSTYLLCCC